VQTSFSAAAGFLVYGLLATAARVPEAEQWAQQLKAQLRRLPIGR